MEHLVESVRVAALGAVERVNDFNQQVFRTRGGRLGSGMGLLLEGLWGYHTNALLPSELEIAWLADHAYNDFAVLDRDSDWDPASRRGERFRVEIKSMNLGAEESKAHFDAPIHTIGAHDELVVVAWRWEEDGARVWPRIADVFVGNARRVAELRDVMHEARGGSFVRADACPDGCQPRACPHVGEPLNAQGRRERPNGPESTRVSSRVSFAANFGGLVRMVKARNAQARNILEEARQRSREADDYLRFIQRIAS